MIVIISRNKNFHNNILRKKVCVMKRSRAFILSEQLLTIMLQAGFILILCTSFYQLISFYTRTQQVLTARSHAERVISFMDDKIRNAGLGLWRCGSSSEIRGKFDNIGMLKTNSDKGYKLPIALKWHDELKQDINDVPLLSRTQDSGNVLTVLYAVKDLSSGSDQLILYTAAPLMLSNNNYGTWKGDLQILDKTMDTQAFKSPALGNTADITTNIKSYVVMESYGYPAYLPKNDNHTVQVFGLTNPSSEDITIPAAGELMGLNCMQMFVHTHEGERQFAFRELVADGTGNTGIKWDTTYNQEKGILDIYMKIDRSTNIFTLWVLASGGYDASLNNPRPETWPKEANPRGNTDEEAKEAWLNASNTYQHHIVYVSRASWKLNNIPQDFIWD